MFERIVTFHPAFDRRSSDPSRDYGIHGVTLRMVLKGDKGAVGFVVYTNWNLPNVTDEMVRKTVSQPIDAIDIKVRFLPTAADLGYHSPTPRYEGQAETEECEYLDGKPCYYDGSSLNADRIYRVLLEKGSDGVWEELEKYYNNLFSEEKSDD